MQPLNFIGGASDYGNKTLAYRYHRMEVSKTWMNAHLITPS